MDHWWKEKASFNKLPDEMVALIASHIQCADLSNFLQTQQRVLEIARKYNFDKPAFKKIILTNGKQFHNGDYGHKLTCILHGPPLKVTRVFRGEFVAVGQPLVDFLTMHVRSTESLKITKTGESWTLENMSAEYLVAIRKLIGKLMLPSPLTVQLSPDEFVGFCTNFKSIDFQKCVITEELICDDVLCRLVESNVVDQYLPTASSYSVLNVSDRLLESITTARRFCQFNFEYCKTSFTVRGIRQFVESLISRKKPLNIDFGEIPADEKDAALQWLQEIMKMNDAPYRMSKRNKYFRVYADFSNSCADSMFAVRPDLD